MIEDIGLLETKKARPDADVFKLIFADGKTGMVVRNTAARTCEIYDIEGDASKTDFDSQRCAIIEKQFGAITGKYVIYRGDTYVPSGLNNVKYINIEEYLRSLSVDK